MYVHPASCSGQLQVVGGTPLAVPWDAVSARQAGPLIDEREAWPGGLLLLLATLEAGKLCAVQAGCV